MGITVAPLFVVRFKLSSDVPSDGATLVTAIPSSFIPFLVTHCSQLSFEFLIGQLTVPYPDRKTKVESILGGANEISCWVSPILISSTVPF